MAEDGKRPQSNYTSLQKNNLLESDKSPKTLDSDDKELDEKDDEE